MTTTKDVVLTIDVDTSAAQARLEQLLNEMDLLGWQRDYARYVLDPARRGQHLMLSVPRMNGRSMAMRIAREVADAYGVPRRLLPARDIRSTPQESALHRAYRRRQLARRRRNRS